MAKKTLIEYLDPVIDEETGVAEVDEPSSEQIFTRKKAWLHHWGSEVSYVYDETGKVVSATQVTIAICEDIETGKILKLNPEQLTVIGFELYNFKK